MSLTEKFNGSKGYLQIIKHMLTSVIQNVDIQQLNLNLACAIEWVWFI